MSQVALKLNKNPGLVETFVRFKAKEGHYIAWFAFIDTGAQVSLFPLSFLEKLEHRIIDEDFEIEQAGIAGQAFKAIEAEITLYVEDLQGNESQPITVRAWFAQTSKYIIGFQDILDRAELHIDYRQSQTGWIEF
jgi:hypothetical protein